VPGALCIRLVEPLLGYSCDIRCFKANSIFT